MDIINHHEIITYKSGDRDKYTSDYIYYDCTIYYMNMERHRDNDQPAVIFADGSQTWYVNGQVHRYNDQPTIIHADGTQVWWFNGQMHRDNDLPAVIEPDGTKEWWVNGEFVRHCRN